MIKFNWHKYKASNEQEIIDRFRNQEGSDLIGINEFFDYGARIPLIYADVFDRLLGQKRQLRPCLFISHKQQDYDEALRIAELAHYRGFDIYLDILDPLLQNQTNAILITNLIELGLLNSTHLIAVMTPNTESSRWVPYEYGRVKEHKIVSDKSASWIHKQVKQLPEYLYLCPVLHSEKAVIQWLNQQNPNGTNQIPWKWGNTKPLLN